jgi:integrase
VAIYIAAFTGMRRGELAGLKWQDVDFENGIISVRREVIFVPGQGHLVTPPKSAKSRRAIDVTPNVITRLRQHRAIQSEERLRLGPVWVDEDWVLTKEDGTHISPNTFSRAFRAIRIECGLPPVRLHDLRHTHASLLLKAGVHLKVVQERLGHSNIAITADTYSHVSAGIQKAAAHDFEKLLDASESQPTAATS